MATPTGIIDFCTVIITQLVMPRLFHYLFDNCVIMDFSTVIIAQLVIPQLSPTLFTKVIMDFSSVKIIRVAKVTNIR